MGLYDYTCRTGHTVEEQRGVEEGSIHCPLCGETAHRQAVYGGTQIMNITGDIGRPVTRDERRKREENGYLMERVSNNSKRIAAETGEKHGPGLRK